MVGNAGEDMAQISLRIKAIEFGGCDQRVDRGTSFTTAIRAEVQEVFTAERQFPFILPISGKKLKSIIVGIRCFVVASRFEMLSSAAEVGSSISTRATVRLGSLPNGCWMLPLAPLWFSASRASA